MCFIVFLLFVKVKKVYDLSFRRQTHKYIHVVDEFYPVTFTRLFWKL